MKRRPRPSAIAKAKDAGADLLTQIPLPSLRATVQASRRHQSSFRVNIEIACLLLLSAFLLLFAGVDPGPDYLQARFAAIELVSSCTAHVPCMGPASCGVSESSPYPTCGPLFSLVWLPHLISVS